MSSTLLPAHAFVSFGMGGAGLDPTYGERWFVQRLRQAGVDCADPFNWSDVQLIVDQILRVPTSTKVFIFGDSLGANEAPAIAAALRGRRKIDGMGGFQPSVWGEHVEITDNVIEAICLYNPVWVQTFGLGDYPWVRAKGNVLTNVSYIRKAEWHPADDDKTVQNAFLNMVACHRVPAAS